MTAIRAQGDLLAGNYWGMPQQFALVENFREIFASSLMGLFFVNSIVVTVTTVVGVLVLSTLAAVALAKYPFPGRTLVFSMFIVGNFVPYQILMIPVRGIVLSLGLYDSIWALIIFHTSHSEALRCRAHGRSRQIVGIWHEPASLPHDAG